LGRFKWLEVDPAKSGDAEEKKNFKHGRKSEAFDKSDESPSGGSGDQLISKFGKTNEADGRVFDAGYFKQEAFKYYIAGDFEKAMFNFSKCLSENNKDEEAWAYQIISQIHLEKFEDALTWAKRAFEFFGSSSDIQGLLALSTALTGGLDGALAYSDGAVAKNKPNYFVWYSRAEILLRSGNYNTAFVCFKSASDFKNIATAKFFDFEIAMALYRAKRFPQALSYFKKVLQAGLCNFFVYDKLGAVNEKLEFFEEAEFYYRLALEMSPSCRTAQEGIKRVADQNAFLIKMFRKISRFFSIGGQKNDTETRD